MSASASSEPLHKGGALGCHVALSTQVSGFCDLTGAGMGMQLAGAEVLEERFKLPAILAAL